ncbi:MAG: hypothetical protein ACXVA9_13195 [Bdellovibrionales bacterium]
MLKLLVLTLTIMTASTSFAKTVKSSKRPKPPKFSIRKDCAENAIDAVHKAFAGDMDIKENNVDDVATIQDPTIEDQKFPNDLTVDVQTINSQDWDGYATYSVTVAPTPKACPVTQVKLVSSEGI